MNTKPDIVEEPLIWSYSKFDNDTVWHSDELLNAFRQNILEHDRWFWLGQSMVFGKEEDKPVLYVARRDSNPILRNPEEALNQLLNTGDYHVTNDELRDVVNSKETMRFPYKTLKPVKKVRRGANICFVEVDTSNYDSASPEQRNLAEFFYGTGDEFVKNMAMIKEQGNDKVVIDLMHPHLFGEQAIGKICRLGTNGPNYNICGDGKAVGHSMGLAGTKHPQQRQMNNFELSDRLKGIELRGINVPSLSCSHTKPDYVRTEEDIEIYRVGTKEVQVKPGHIIDDHGNIVDLESLQRKAYPIAFK